MDSRGKRDAAVAAMFVAVLVISAFWGQHDRKQLAAGDRAVIRETETPGAQTGEDTKSREGAQEGNIARAGEDRREGESAPAGLTGQQDGSLPDVPQLDEEQGTALREIMEDLKGNKMEEAARAMKREEDMLWSLYYETMEGDRYLFDGTGLQPALDGEGLVLTKAGTAYYGTFKDGKPEGKCTAIQVVDMDAPRYDYSQGIWKNGMMEGDGRTGYCYYEESPEGEARDICRTGTFSEDLLEGEVLYTSMNDMDGTSTWKVTVDEGIIQLDERWTPVGNGDEFQLMSEDNDSHGYVVGKEQIDQVMWRNLLVWIE